MPITSLPTKPTGPVTLDPKIHIIYGPPKIGKTTIVSTIPNGIILDLEDGSDYVTATKLKINSVAELKQACSLILNSGKPYSFLIVDTITKLEEWAEEDATVEYKKTIQGKSFTGSSVLSLPMGAGYFWLRQSFMGLVSRLCMLAPYIILIGHIRDKMIESQGKEVSSKDLDLTGKLKSITCAKADAIGYLMKDKTKGNYVLTYSTKDDIVCGSRCPHLKGSTFEMDPDPLKFDWSKIYTHLSLLQQKQETKTSQLTQKVEELKPFFNSQPI